MDDSIRASKRRRLETSKAAEARAAAAGEQAEDTTGRRSARAPTQPAKASTEETSDKAVEEATEKHVPKPRGRPPKNAPKETKENLPAPKRRGRPPKNATKEPQHEAALEGKPAPGESVAEEKPAPKRRGRPPKNATKEPQHETAPEGKPAPGESVAEEKPAPKRRGRPPKNAIKATEETSALEKLAPKKRGRPPKSASRSTPAAPIAKDLFDDIEGALGVQGSSDELQQAPAAPEIPAVSKRGRGRPRKNPIDANQSISQPKKRATAIHSRSIQPNRAFQPLETIPDSEDELLGIQPPIARKMAAATRRKLSRTDHIDNHDDAAEPVAQQDSSADEMDVDGDSLVGSVLDPTEPSPFNKPPSAQKEKAAPLPLVYGNIAEGRELDLLKTVVMERIAGKRPSPLVGLDEEYKSVHQLVEHTITAGEGNSMLLIGARGSGKSALVKKVLSEISKDHGGEYYVVKLNGFIHTDDKIALRDIWRQLGKEMDVEEDGSGPGKNYADTLTTLLALLSHPSEQTGEHTDQVAKAIIFVMDEFDLFAQHPRQTLLYNLFDIAQSRKAPIAVLGLTTRIDVTNSLEKRVKSRFSHRYVHLGLAKTFTIYQEICKACLIVQHDQLSVEERGLLEGGTKTTPGRKRKSDVKQDVLEEWNANVEKLFTSSAFIKKQLAPTFHLTKSVPTTLQSFLLPTATLSVDQPFMPQHLEPLDSKLAIIPHLSTLAISLLIAAARLDIIHDSDQCNFNMAYDEYVSLASKARIQSAAGGLSASGSVSKVWGKNVARREWDGLLDLGLVMPVVQGQTGGFGMIRCDVALEEIGATLAGEKNFDRGLERWCRAL